MVTCSLGAGVGVDGVDTAAACLRVLILDMLPYRSLLQGVRWCPVFVRGVEFGYLLD
jgi:hypothetical protein